MRRFAFGGLLLAALLMLAAPATRAQLACWTDAGYPAPLLSRIPVYGPGVITSLWMPPGSMPEALAYSPATGDLVYGEASWTNARIRRTNPGLLAPVTLVSGQSCIRGLAANASTGELYWTTSNLVTGSQLHRCDSDGGSPTVLAGFGSSSNLRGIALDAGSGKMYLADYDQGLIQVANLDASGLAVFQNLGAGAGPWGVVLDPAGQKLYWCEYASGRVRVAGTAGGPVTTIYSGLGNPTNLAFLADAGAPGGGYLLWSEAAVGAQRITLALLDGSGAFATSLPITAYGGIVITPGGTLGVDPNLLTTEFSLSRVTPNPASAASVVEFGLPAEMRVRLSLVDVQGRRVASLFDGTLPAGRHSVPLAAAWEVRRPAAGVYFLRLEAGAGTRTRKLIVTD